MLLKYNIQSSKVNAIAYAFLRTTFGILLMINGWNNWLIIPASSNNFPDPLGIGSEISVYLTVFVQLFCGLAITIGLLTRLACIPVIVTFLVAVFLVHGNDSFNIKQAAILYLFVSIYCMVNGSGCFSLTHLIRRLGGSKEWSTGK